MPPTVRPVLRDRTLVTIPRSRRSAINRLRLPTSKYRRKMVRTRSRRMSEMTIAYYDRMAEAYWDGTRDHDVSQNYASLLDAIENDPPYSILDLGCGPGRDLRHFRSSGHNAVGLD